VIQDFEDHIFDRAYREQYKGRGFDLRKCLIQMRRFAAPMREVIGRFLRETPLVSPDLVPYFEDVQDHVVTITEAVGIGLDNQHRRHDRPHRRRLHSAPETPLALRCL
jgi:Mg2+ and Co2+ transporter CorA